MNPTANPAVLAAPATPAAFVAPGTPAAPGLPAVFNTVDGFVDEFDWSNFGPNIATGNTTIPKAPWAPLAEDGLFSSFLDELAADLPNDIFSNSATATNVSTPTAANPLAVPTTLVPATLVSPAPGVPAAADSPIASSPVVSEESNAQPTSSTTEPPAAGSPVVSKESNAQTETTSSNTEPPAAGPAPSAASVAEGTTTSDLGPLSNIDDPTVLPLRPRKRGRDVTEDPAFIVTGKRVRKPSERKEWETMTTAKGKENRRPKKGKGTSSKRTKAV